MIRMLRPLLLALLLVPAARAEEVISDDWGVLRLMEADVGYVHQKVVRRTDDAGPLLELNIETLIVMRRMGSTIEVKQTSISLEREDGRIIRLESRASTSKDEQLGEVTFEGGKAIVAMTVAGKRRVTEVDCPDDVVGMYHIDRMSRAMPRDAGAKVSARTFSPETGGVTLMTTTSEGMEETTLRDGSKRTLWKHTSTMDTLPIVTIVWADEQGRPVKTQIPIAGMVLEVYDATETEARLAAAGGELPPDVFQKTLVVSPHPAAYPRHAEEALLRIRRRAQADKLPGLGTPAQVVTDKNGEDSMLLRVTSRVPPADRNARPLPEDVRPSLAPNSMIQCDAPEILAIAKDVVGDERDAWRAARMLERWVHDNVTSKNLDVAFASALEVCRNREGDCTEHAVFLAALCRAAGVPADVVMGVEYLGSVWGGHAWTKVWIDGDWYALDATNGYGFVDALHLEFGHASLKDAAFGTELANVLLSLGKIDIEIVETTRGGRKTRPDDPALMTADKAGYRNAAWGIAFPAPVGFDLEPQGSGASLMTKLLEMEGKNSAGKNCQITVHAFDAPADRDLDRQAGFLVSAGASCAATTVDGRPARLLTIAEGGRRRAYAVILAGDALWMIDHDGVDADDDLAAFADFLKTIRFDV